MKVRTVKKVLALALAGMMLCLTACGSDGDASGSAGGESTSKETEQGNGGSEIGAEAAGITLDFDTVDHVTLYPFDTTTTSGVVGSYQGEVLAKRGIELEIWAYSDEKTNAILASGDLPDVMYVTYDNMVTMIEGGMVLNLEEYLDCLPHIAEHSGIQTALNYVREFRSAGTGQVYGIPTSIGRTSDASELGKNCVTVLWSAYVAAGYPEINSFDDLIPVMKEMLAAYPESELDGTPTVGTVLNAGSDDTYWGCISEWYKWHGYEPDNLAYLLETDMFNGKYVSILEADRDSLYYQGLKWYNQCYREGLLDPDSINNERNVQKAKVETSQCVVLPSGSLQGYAGCKGVYVPGQTVYQENWTTPYGGNYYLVVNAKTQNLEGALKLLDGLANLDMKFEINHGPQGYLWDFDENGLVVMTEEGIDREVHPENYADEEEKGWPGYGEQTAFMDIWILEHQNYGPSYSYIGADGNPRHSRVRQSWYEVVDILAQKEDNVQWVEHFGYKDLKEQLKDHNAYKLNSDLDNVKAFASTPDDIMQLTVDAVKDVVVSASWKMVYAESDEEFDKLWDQMIQDCVELNNDNDIVAWRLEDLSHALEIVQSLEAN